MKHVRLFHIAPMVWVLNAALLLMSAITWFFCPVAAYIELGITLVLVVISLVRLSKEQNDIDRYMRRVLRHINESDEQSLNASPLPIAVISDGDQIVWHNASFEFEVLDGHSCIGELSKTILPSIATDVLYQTNCLEIDLHDRHYMVYVSPLSLRGKSLFVLYYLDVTKLHNIALEHAATRPVVMLIDIDNLDELMQRLRDSERARIEGLVENALEDWLFQTTGVLRKIDGDRFMVIIEKHYLSAMIESRFDILDRIRSIPLENGLQITLSIGVGDGPDFRHAEKMARQALEMALGRGGDQVAIRTKNGFDFYGGLSKGVEKRNKVRTRVMASALQDLILSSENVIVMGHRFSDLDCLGSAAVLTRVARSLGKPAYVAVSRKTSLAEELFIRFEKAGYGDLFIDPSEALGMIRPKTLLIITDTQMPQMLEFSAIYERASIVAVIDHHRKSNGHIEDAVLFYHESVASSACEMVAELVQYLDIPDIGTLEAEALLAGIMLDTRNFVLKSGVRTFEAAAFLRKQGADTVSVKKIFSGSMDMYRQKSAIVSDVQFYKNAAIACAPKGEGANLRIACAQAADELLTIKGTEAAFTCFADGNNVNISARSYGGYNVQLIMEYLGGGGHLTMAGAQLKNISIRDAVDKLRSAIDRYIRENNDNL